MSTQLISLSAGCSYKLERLESIESSEDSENYRMFWFLFCSSWYKNPKVIFRIRSEELPEYRFSSSDLIMLFVSTSEPVIYAYFLLEKISCDYFSFQNRLLFDLVLLIVLYWVGSSLCLYNITTFFIFQDGILSKVTNMYLCNIQICACCGHFPLTCVYRYAMIFMLGGL